MKTSININLFGTVYAIDEDAHRLLDQYLTNLRSYFSKQTGGDEICDDLEHRVAELFWELKQQGNESISIEQVTEIMHKIGNPEEMGTQNADTESHANIPAEEPSKGQGESRNEGQRSYASNNNEKTSGSRRYYRDGQNKILGGVLSGACHYFGWTEPLMLRLLFVLLCLFTDGIFVLLYLLFWLIAPKAVTAEERLKMKGEAVNPETIKSEILNGAAANNTAASNNHSGCLKVLLGMLLAPFGCVALFVLFILAVVLFSVAAGLFGGAIGMLGGGGVALATLIAAERGTMVIVLICAIAIIAIPIYCLYRWFRRDVNPLSSLNAIILGGIWLLALIFGWYNSHNLKEKFSNIDYSTINFDFDKDHDQDWDVDFDIDNDSVITAADQLSVDDFHDIKFEGVGKVVFTQDSVCKVEVSGADWIKKHTLISSENDCLCITLDDEAHNKKNKLSLTIRVSAPYLKDVTVEGVGSFDIKDDLKQDEPLALNMKGVGKIRTKTLSCPKVTAVQEGIGKTSIDVETDSLIVTCKGVGKMTMKGRAANYQRNNEEFICKIDDSQLRIGQ